jgi:hypothetical protein
MSDKAFLSAILAAGAFATVGGSTAAATVTAHPATGTARSGLISTFTASDGSAAEIRGLYLANTNPPLGVVCIRTPDAGAQAYVFRRSGRSWRYVTSGVPGRSGNATDRQLERSCP